MITPESIKEFRKLAGLTQEKLAQLIPCSICTVASWEQGKKNPTGLYLARLTAIIADGKEGEK